MKTRRAFTLIELLVVISIISILMGVLMPALRRVREQARERSCGSRIRQHVLVMNMYADENDSKMPMPTTGGNWLQDLSINTVHYMLSTGLTREMFYCPSNANHQRYNDLFWEFDNQSWDGARFTDYTDNDFIVSGYCYLLQLHPPRAPRPPIRKYTTDMEDKIWIKTTQEKQAGLRELVVDTIMGVPESGTKYGYNFGQVPGGIYQSDGVYDQTSHLENDYEPMGGNVGFLDGHVEWRAFKPEMVGGSSQAIARFTSGGVSFFW